MGEKQNVEGLQSAVFLVGIYEGVLPFVAKVVGWHPFLAFPARLDAPLWWIVSAAVIVVASVLLMALDGVKVDLVKRDAPPRDVPPRGGALSDATIDVTKRDA